MAYISRRSLLTRMGALGFASGVGAISGATAGKSWASSNTNYKALVCIFLKGGMDHADTVLPYDAPSYDQLASARQDMFSAYRANSGSSSRFRENILKLNPTDNGMLSGRELGLPRELSQLHSMFEEGDLAILGNVGPLVEPTNRRQIEAGTAVLPSRLFSHNDQQSTWMSLGVEGQQRGWGGLFADSVLAASPNADPSFISISATSNDVFLSGNQAQPFRITSNGATLPALSTREGFLGRTVDDDEARRRIRDHLARTGFNDRNLFAQDLRNATGRALASSERLLAARENATPFTATFEDDNFGNQLKSVAETIKIQSSLNVPRQIFYVGSGPFDTHTNQSNIIGTPHAQLSSAIAAFRSAMQEIGQWNNVAVFTMSDFGRTLVSNGNGTDHGWGGHHLIAGGQVNGNRLYGEFPEATPTSANYTTLRGRMIPTTSVEQYAATLGRWFGLSSGELRAALPNLGNFDQPDLGFLG